MKRAFTLAEIIVVLVIIGILVTLAISQFGPGKERTLGKEAIANLKLIAAAEKIYRIENSFYYPNYATAGTVSNVTDINSNLKLFLSEKNWDYNITYGTTGASFNSTADRIDTNVGPPYKDCIYSINQTQEEPSNTTYCP